MKTPETNPSFPLNALVQAYGVAIGDTLPKDVGFVLLLFQGGKHPGICYQTNCTAEAVAPVLNQTCVELEASRLTPSKIATEMAIECGEEIAKEAYALLGGGVTRILLDLEKTKIVNSIGISILIEILEKLLDQGGKLAFCRLTPTIEKTFQIMGLAQYARIFPAPEIAVAWLRGETE